MSVEKNQQLIDFILARVAEDEQLASAGIDPDKLYPWGDKSLPPRKAEDFAEDVKGYLGGTWGDHCANWSPIRVLRMCTSIRAILESMAKSATTGTAATDRMALIALASLYSYHPDYPPRRP